MQFLDAGEGFGSRPDSTDDLGTFVFHILNAAFYIRLSESQKKQAI